MRDVHGRDVQRAQQLRVVDAGSAPRGLQRIDVGRLGGAEASEASTVERRAQGIASAMRDRPEAWRAVSDEHTGVGRLLALDADAVSRERQPPAGKEGGDRCEQLTLADGAAAKLVVHRHVSSDRRAGGQCLDPVGPGVDD